MYKVTLVDGLARKGIHLYKVSGGHRRYTEVWHTKSRTCCAKTTAASRFLSFPELSTSCVSGAVGEEGLWRYQFGISLSRDGTSLDLFEAQRNKPKAQSIHAYRSKIRTRYTNRHSIFLLGISSPGVSLFWV